MNNIEKDQLRRLVIEAIKTGKDCTETVAKLKRHGYTPSTVRRYYKAFS